MEWMESCRSPRQIVTCCATRKRPPAPKLYRIGTVTQIVDPKDTPSAALYPPSCKGRLQSSSTLHLKGLLQATYKQEPLPRSAPSHLNGLVEPLISTPSPPLHHRPLSHTPLWFPPHRLVGYCTPPLTTPTSQTSQPHTFTTRNPHRPSLTPTCRSRPANKATSSLSLLKLAPPPIPALPPHPALPPPPAAAAPRQPAPLGAATLSMPPSLTIGANADSSSSNRRLWVRRR